MHSNAILDGHLYVRLDLSDPDIANGQFRSDTSRKGHLASQLLLYDRVVIPTKDLGVIPILIEWIGLEKFREALEADTLRFARTPSLLGYAGIDIL